jgi:hypothetical protein
MKKLHIFLIIIISLILFLGCNPTLDKPQIDEVTPGDGEVTLKWRDVTDATSYNIYYKEGDTVTVSDGTKVEDVSSPHTVTGLTNGTMYAFGLTAVVEGNETEMSEVVTATPIAMWSVSFDNTDFNGGNKNDSGSKIAIDDSDNIYVAGTSFDSGTDEQIAWVMMLDSSGNQSWSVNITDTDALSVETLVLDGDALYIGLNKYTTAGINGRIEKLSITDGSFYGGSWPANGIILQGSVDSDFVNDILVKDGAIYVVGADEYGGSTHTPPWVGDWLIAKYSATDGTLDSSWATNPVIIDGTSSGDGDDDDVAYNVVADDTNLYIVGRYGYAASPYYSQGFASITLADGTVNWGGTDDKYEFNHDPDYREIPDGMTMDSSSNLYTTASMDKLDITVGGNDVRLYQKGWLLSVDSTGNKLWEVTFEPNNFDYMQLESIITDETSIYVVGHESNDYSNTDIEREAIVRKFDMSGVEDTNWETNYVFDESATTQINSFSDVVLKGYAMYVVGHTVDPTSGYDFWVAKLGK